MTSHPGGLSSSTNILSQWRRMWQRGPACRVILFERNRQGKDMLHISHPGSHYNYNSTQLNTIIRNTSDRIFPCPHCNALAHFPLNHWLWPNQCRGHLVEVCKEETVSLGRALLQLHLLEQALHEKPDAVEDHSGAERVEHLVGHLTLIVLNYHDDEAPNVCTENKQLLKDTELLKIFKPC